MLDRQDRLIASLKKIGWDTSDAILLRTEIAALLESICGEIPVFKIGRLNLAECLPNLAAVGAPSLCDWRP
jgi:hypothetical protein